MANKTKKEVYEELKSMIPLTRNKETDFLTFLIGKLDEYNRIAGHLYSNNCDYRKVLEFIECIKTSAQYYFEGRVFSSMEKFKKGIISLLGDSIDDYNGILPVYNKSYGKIMMNKNGFTPNLYRLTRFQNSIWHIPFEIRHLSSSARFSVPGLPCLYLGNSIDTCNKEIGEPKNITDHFVSLFEFDYTKKPILDLTMSKLYHEQLDDEFYDGAIFSWPLIAACMIKKRNDYEEGTKFISEYLFPQYVISLLTEHELTGIWGVKYFSTKFEINEERFNIAIPIRESKQSDHCEQLKSLFKYEYRDSQPYKYNVTIPKTIGSLGGIYKAENELLKMKKDNHKL